MQVFSFLVVHAGREDHFGKWLLYAKASHDFYRGPYYNNVSPQMEDTWLEDVIEYAQL